MMTKRSFSLALLVVAGCTGSTPKQAPPANHLAADLLQLIPECPKPAVAPEPDGPLRVFVELVKIDAPTETLRSAGSIEDLVAEPTATIASEHALAQFGERADLGGTAVTARVDRAASRITLDVAADTPEGYTRLAVADGQRVILGSPVRNGRSKIAILVPTIVSSQADLRRIFECKMEQARLARGRRKS